jgi:hypothetical protein
MINIMAMNKTPGEETGQFLEFRIWLTRASILYIRSYFIFQLAQNWVVRKWSKSLVLLFISLICYKTSCAPTTLKFSWFNKLIACKLYHWQKLIIKFSLKVQTLWVGGENSISVQQSNKNMNQSLTRVSSWLSSVVRILVAFLRSCGKTAGAAREVKYQNSRTGNF